MRGQSARNRSISAQVRLVGDLLRHELADLPGAGAGRRIGPPVLQHGESVPHVVLQPERTPERIQLRSERELKRAAEAVAPVALPVCADRDIDRDDQGGNSEVGRAPDHVLRDRPVLRRVHLEPAMLRGLARHVLHRCGSGTGHDERNVGVARRPRQHQVAAMAVIADAAGGRDAVRARPCAAEQVHRLVERRDIHHVARNQRAARKGALIALQPRFVVHTAFDEVVNQLRHAPLRQHTQVIEVDALVDIHSALPRRRSPAGRSIPDRLRPVSRKPAEGEDRECHDMS